MHAASVPFPVWIPGKDECSSDYADIRGMSINGMNVPIVIDNGSFETRAGWASEAMPRLRFPSRAMKIGNGRDGEKNLFVGNEMIVLEQLNGLRFSPFSSNVPIRMDVQEMVLDHIMLKLGLGSADDLEGCVPHPIVMTEPLCVPVYARRLMTELLFECYGIPGVCYGVDAAFSLFANVCPPDLDAEWAASEVVLDPSVIVSASHRHTHVIPIYDNRISSEHCLRMSVGGFHMEKFTDALMRIRYPHLSLNEGDIRMMLSEHAYYADDFLEELTAIQEDADFAKSQECVLQVAVPPGLIRGPITEEEREKRRLENEERGRRLREGARIKRERKEKALTDRVASLEKLQPLLETAEDPSTSTKRKNKILKKNQALMASLDVSSLEDVERDLEDSKAKLARVQERAAAANERNSGDESKANREPETLEEVEARIAEIRQDTEWRTTFEAQKRTEERASFPLLFMPEEEMSDAQKEERRKQASLHNMWRGRRNQALQRMERRRADEIKRLETERERLSDPDAWMTRLRIEKQAIEKRRKQRQRRRTQLSDRRSSAAKERMRMIVQHSSAGLDDDFGADDSHWAVYRQMAKDGDDSSDDDDEERLLELTSIIEKYDPHAAEADEQQSILEDFQIRLSVDRIRVPEILFQPSISGVRQCGLAETLQLVLRRLPEQMAHTLGANVFLCGGTASFKNFVGRVQREVTMLTPMGTQISVNLADDPMLDAWKGARAWANHSSFASSLITQQAYQEFGPDYLVEHPFSNHTQQL